MGTYHQVDLFDRFSSTSDRRLKVLYSPANARATGATSRGRNKLYRAVLTLRTP